MRLTRFKATKLLERLNDPNTRAGGGDPRRAAAIVRTVLPALLAACHRYNLSVPDWLGVDEMEKAGNVDSEMARQARAAIPNPHRQETHYPCRIEINGVAQHFSAYVPKQRTSRTKKTIIHLHQYREHKNGLQSVAHYKIDGSDKITHQPALGKHSQAHLWPNLSDKTTVHDAHFDEFAVHVKTAMAAAAGVKPKTAKLKKAGPRKPAAQATLPLHDVSDEPRVPKGNKGAGQWTRGGPQGGTNVPLTKLQEKQVDRALEAGLAELKPLDGVFTVRVRPVGAARWKTIGPFKDLVEARRAILPTRTLQSE